MIFYHYTSETDLPAILREGLTKGEIPITADHVENGVWFTTLPDPAGHGLADGEEISPEICQRFGYKPGSRWKNKRAIRITVTMPMAKLKYWPPYARKRLTPQWYATLSKVGGGARIAKTWYISFNPIPPEQFAKVERRTASGWEAI